MTATWTPTAADLVAALRAHYLPPGALRQGTDEWSLLTEVPSVGSPAHDPDDRSEWDPDASIEANQQALAAWRDRQTVRSIDVLLVRNWRSGKVPFERIAVEIKVARGDFLRETAGKRGAWQALAHRFAYCTPTGLLAPQEIPDDCWLIEIDEHPCAHAAHAPTRVHWNRKVKGARRAAPPLPTELSVFFARQASRAQETLRAGEGSAAAALTERALTKAQERIRVLESREESNRARVSEALALIAPLGRQVCADCGEPIRAFVPAGYRSAEWRHRTTELDNTCLQRRLAARDERDAAAGYGRFYRSPIEVEPLLLRQERERAAAEEQTGRAEQQQWRARR